MPTNLLASFRSGLRENHHKLTRPRRLVLEVIAEADHHLTPAEVYRKAKARNPRLGLTSVYRTLELLARLGLVQHIHMNHRHRHYAPVRRDHGHHLVCNGCGRVVEFADCDLEGLARRLARRTRFTIEGHSVELFGRCPDCQPRRKDS
jgi:Fur family ferric uptake transcriptional regulator